VGEEEVQPAGLPQRILVRKPIGCMGDVNTLGVLRLGGEAPPRSGWHEFVFSFLHSHLCNKRKGGPPTGEIEDWRL